MSKILTALVLYLSAWSTTWVSGEADPPVEPCPEPTILTALNGTITSPSYPAPYPTNLNTCVWILALNVSETLDVYLWLDDFDVDSGDELRIHNGEVSESLIHNFTGRQEFGVVYSNAVNTTLEFVKGNKSTGVSGRRFKLNYTTSECFVKTDKTSGVLHSPYYAMSDGSFQCIYEIGDSDPEKAIAFTFDNFNLTKAYVAVKNGNATLANYTHDNPDPDDQIFAASRLNVSMQLARSVADNFVVLYTETDKECSEEQVITSQTEIRSLANPGNNGNNLDCRWIIHSPGGTTMSLQFTNLTMADVSDHVIIKDGGSQVSDNIGIFSQGSRTADVYYLTSSNVTWIQFRTDQFLGASSFKLNITPQAYGRRFVNTANFSFGIPPNHTNITEPELSTNIIGDIVSFQFQAQSDSQVYLTFGRSATLFPTTIIEFYDGLSVEDPLIGYFTSTTPFRPVFSNGNAMLVLVKGFLVNGTMTQQYINGTFTAPINDGTLLNSLDVVGGHSLSVPIDHYPYHATWLIHNHLTEELVSLKLDSVVIGPNSTLSVYQGLSDQDLRIAKLSNGSTNQLPEIYVSKDREGCRVVYETNHTTPNFTEADLENESQIILRATYSLKQDCNRNLTGVVGTWMTPNYPDSYPFNARCVTTFNFTQGKMAHFTFADFSLAPFHGLTLVARYYHDYNVKIDNKTHQYTNITERKIAEFGGQGVPNDVITGDDSTANRTDIVATFSSWSPLGIDVASGVNMTYEIIDCGGNLTGMNGSFAGMQSKNKSFTCVWIISLPNIVKHNGSVNIVSFTYQYKNDNISILDIRDGPSSFSEAMPLTTHSSSKNPILSRSNALWIKYASKGGANVFTLNYTTYECVKAQQCNNSICMHDDWKCNGRDDCGDGSDEDGCTYNHNGGKNTGYAGWALAVAIVATLVIAVAATFAAQAIYKRCRYQNYDELRDLMAPVPT